MKKILSYFAIISAMLAVAACDPEEIKNDPTPNVGFVQSTATVVVDPGAITNTLEMTVARANIESDASYSVTVTSDNGTVITAPSTISFEAGVASIKILFSFNAELMEVGGKYEFVVKLGTTVEDGSSLTPTLTITATLEPSWETVGTGTFYCGFFYDDELQMMTLQKAKGMDLYRIQGAIAGKNSNFEFSVDNNNVISFEEQFTGYTHPTYGKIYVEEHRSAASEGLNVREDNTFLFGAVFFDDEGYWSNPNLPEGIELMVFELGGTIEEEEETGFTSITGIIENMPTEADSYTLNAYVRGVGGEADWLAATSEVDADGSFTLELPEEVDARYFSNFYNSFGFGSVAGISYPEVKTATMYFELEGDDVFVSGITLGESLTEAHPLYSEKSHNVTSTARDNDVEISFDLQLLKGWNWIVIKNETTDGVNISVTSNQINGLKFYLDSDFPG